MKLKLTIDGKEIGTIGESSAWTPDNKVKSYIRQQNDFKRMLEDKDVKLNGGLNLSIKGLELMFPSKGNEVIEDAKDWAEGNGLDFSPVEVTINGVLETVYHFSVK